MSRHRGRHSRGAHTGDDDAAATETTAASESTAALSVLGEGQAADGTASTGGAQTLAVDVPEFALVGGPDAVASSTPGAPMVGMPDAPVPPAREEASAFEVGRAGAESAEVTGSADASDAAPGAVAVLELTIPTSSPELLATTIVVAPQTARRRHRWWPWAVLVVLFAVVVGVLVQVGRPLPGATFHTALATSSTVAGSVPAMPWPAVGEAAVSVPALGVTLTPATEPQVPIASLTKIMTAYLTLRDHPLAPTRRAPP